MIHLPGKFGWGIQTSSETDAERGTGLERGQTLGQRSDVLRRVFIYSFENHSQCSFSKHEKIFVHARALLSNTVVTRHLINCEH